MASTLGLFLMFRGSCPNSPLSHLMLMTEIPCDIFPCLSIPCMSVLRLNRLTLGRLSRLLVCMVPWLQHHRHLLNNLRPRRIEDKVPTVTSSSRVANITPAGMLKTCRN